MGEGPIFDCVRTSVAYSSYIPSLAGLCVGGSLSYLLEASGTQQRFIISSLVPSPSFNCGGGKDGLENCLAQPQILEPGMRYMGGY